MKPSAIIDAHCHLWQLNNEINGWLDNPNNAFLGDISAIQQDYLLKDYQKDSADFPVEKIVHIEAANSAHAIKEIQWLAEQYDDNDYLYAVVGGASLTEKNIEAQLDYYHHSKKVSGVRDILNWHETPAYRSCDRQDYMTDRQWQRNFALLAKYQLSFDMQIVSSQLAQAYQLAKTYDEVSIIIDHAAFPLPDGIAHWQQSMKKIAQCDNVVVKLSGFGPLSRKIDKQTVRDQVLYLIEQFGVNRCMFASNFPVEKLYIAYNDLFNFFNTIVQDFNNTEKQALFYDTALRVYQKLGPEPVESSRS
ncbi:MAG: amidohydrolase family protein [Pseudomonadota bacterium]